MAYQRNGTFRFILIATLLIGIHQHANAFNSMSKENIFADVLLAELLNRMDKDINPAQNYFDFSDELPKNVDLVSRSSKTNNGHGEYGYRAMFGSHPSIRDQEYLQHSTLWGHQYINGGMAEMPNRFPAIKSDSTLPAYCNPPNPCPYGYDESQGCILDFENTAIFSREFQAAQECTCDNEHMFDCAGEDSNASTNEMTSTMEKFLMHQFQNDNGIDNSNAVVKKFYGFAGGNGGLRNPFLQGEKLPIAAKKGDDIRA
ncbi:neuroendocrine protein 7B2 isoform X1 [Eurosta solidaginis]|uniref:neuroendocrine protein 7B2 isoform X1 n=2 Tax=Eurosta solidaginis TaxID=178769 RepID=UPI0035317BD4